MKIQSMHLGHYRCFEDFKIDFDDRLTVLVGTNGAGKTAVLDALGLFLKQAGHPTNRYASYQVPISDVSIGSTIEDLKYRLEVQPGSMGDKTVQLRLIYKRTYQHNLNFAIEGNTPIKDILAAENPLFVAYMAGRFVAENASVLTQNAQSTSAYAAYENNFNRTIDFASTISWFDKVDADEARAMRDSGQKDELPELKAVREALSKALLGKYERPRMLGNPPELIVYQSGTDLAYKVSQISDGYRAMLALVMDLARRMAQSREKSNPNESLLHVPAVVLIDEVELHLHPSWQQTVLTTLMDIFPNTQFIVTTHSPQVLTSIPQRHIRILSDGKAYSVNEQTQGAEASRLLKHVFGVDLRPNSLEIVKALKDYSRLVYDEKWDTPEAEKLKKLLYEHYSNDDPELMELELHIDNIKWEQGL